MKTVLDWNCPDCGRHHESREKGCDCHSEHERLLKALDKIAHEVQQLRWMLNSRLPE